MSRLPTFNPAEVVLAINDFVVKGFADGTFIELYQNSPYFKLKRGIRGRSSKVRLRDRSGVLIIRLMQTSSDNEVLSKIVEQDYINQTGLLQVTLRDVGGQTAMQLNNAFIEGPPNISYSSQQTTPREWKIHYEYLSSCYVAGNDAPLLDFL